MEEDIGESKTEGEEVKRIRRRRKRVYQAILKQMEFYFSDANLLKDRFLNKLIKEDPFVDLSVFLTFNKIRALTDNVEDIANALSKSELLKLSSDRSKVAREKPLNPNYNEDECSIYVENLPLDAKHDWLSDVFSVYGKVAYVSIPKYRQSGKIKGFAFVEFESVEAANRALKAYVAAGCCLPTDMPPENLCSIATFEPGEGKNQVGFVEKPVKLEEEQDEGEIEDPKENVAEPVSTKEEADDGNCVSPPKEKKKKRKREEDEDEIFLRAFIMFGLIHKYLVSKANEEPPEEKEKSPPIVKKRRSKEGCVSDENEDDILGASKKKKKKGKANDEEESSVLEGGTSIEAAEDASPVSKKKIKKSKAGDAEEDSNKADEGTGDSNLASTEESSKDKEKRKRKLEDSENEEQQLEDGNKRAKAEEEEAITSDTPEDLKEKKKKKRKRNKEKKDKLTEEAICLQILSKKEWKRLRNKYLMLQRKNMKQLRAQIMGHRWEGPWKKENGRNGAEMHDEDWQDEAEHRGEYSEEHTPMDDEKTDIKPESSIRVQFTPGVILKVQLKEPLESAKKFKAEVKHLPKSNLIAYIDARDANSIVHLRCETAEAAKDLLEDLPWEDREILDGEEEKGYWDKILQDRDEKIKKKIRVKKRGRDKILGKAENLIGKHLRYDN
ncbi:hypothetical protein J437_LFUL007772 [Ladona fulva]|uniref:La-related protein 7 n=1 Tax=Ladona fulva TaxID=123851 RepID=A0A8K0NYN1_LADFU|nr:hypothetical protein J437_LFUL007772 [Ladona fulva]